IAVDTLTGAITVEKVWAVHDVGRIINPMGAISQVTGGVLQAIGFALTEERVVVPTTGTVVNAGLEDYKVPTIADTPEIVYEFVDLRGAVPAGILAAGQGIRIGAATRIADIARDPDVGARFAVLAEAAAAVASPQLREMGTVAGNLCQAVRCWYFRHPDLTCWLRGGDTCYAQIGDHRKHGLEPGDCISVAPSDLAAGLLALDAVVTTNRR